MGNFDDDEADRRDNSSPASERQIAKMSEVHNFSAAVLDNLKVLHPATASKASLKTFRELRTQLYSHARHRNFSCLVSSVVPHGGGSYVATNLAAAIALDRAKTSVLIDCNFHSSSLAPLLSAQANLGLTDFLSIEEMGAEFVIYASGVPRMRLVPSGNNPQESTEKLSSSKMRAFLRELKARYPDRYIVIDGPAVGDLSADVRILAELVDFVVLVVPSGKVTDEDVGQAVETIGQDRLAGVVLNAV